MLHAIETAIKARADILSNTSWLRRKFSPSTAERWAAGVRAAIASLARHPERCQEASEAASLDLDLRELHTGRRPHVFRILFTIEGDTVNVLRIRHAAQDRLNEDDL